MASTPLKSKTVVFLLAHVMKELVQCIEWASQKKGVITIDWPISDGDSSSGGRPVHSGGTKMCLTNLVGNRADTDFFLAVLKAMKKKGGKK